MSEGSLAIVCGSGALALEAAAVARAGGREVYLIGLAGSATRDIEAYPHVWLRLGEFGRLFSTLKQWGVAEVAMLGAVSRPDFSDLKLDWGALKRVGEIVGLLGRGDDALLVGFAGMIEQEGFRVVGVADFAPGLLAPAGMIVGRAPGPETQAEIAFGSQMLNALSPFDVGQGAVIAGRRVIAVEAAEGTDAMLSRVAELRSSGRVRLKGKAGIFIKAAKRGQDMRLDLPAVGPGTIAAAARAELRGLALAAGQILIAEREKFVAAADAAGLFVFGWPT